jgi:hypothetical protein
MGRPDSKITIFLRLHSQRSLTTDLELRTIPLHRSLHPNGPLQRTSRRYRRLDHGEGYGFEL